MCFPASCLSVHFSPVSACQLPGSGLCLRSQNMGGLFSSFGAGQVKVEAGKDGSSVYFDWVNGVYEPLMQALESVTNHLHEATNDSFVFTAVGLRVTWGILVVLVALRYVYGCKLAKEHKDPESGYGPKPPGVHFRQYPSHHIDMMPGSSGQDPVATNKRRTSVAEPVPGIKIKVETDNG